MIKLTVSDIKSDNSYTFSDLIGKKYIKMR